jgi:hypothetical protein
MHNGITMSVCSCSYRHSDIYFALVRPIDISYEISFQKIQNGLVTINGSVLSRSRLAYAPFASEPLFLGQFPGGGSSSTKRRPEISLPFQQIKIGNEEEEV